MFQKIEIEIDIPEGYEFVRYGVPEIGESYMSFSSSRYVYLRDQANNIATNTKYFVVSKVKQWRDPVLPADNGKQARFKDDEILPWDEELGTLRGWMSNRWYASRGGAWKFCQVCDEETK